MFPSKCKVGKYQKLRGKTAYFDFFPEKSSCNQHQ